MSPDAWSLTMMSGNPLPVTSPIVMSDGAIAGRHGYGRRERPGTSGRRW